LRCSVIGGLCNQRHALSICFAVARHLQWPVELPVVQSHLTFTTVVDDADWLEVPFRDLFDESGAIERLKEEGVTACSGASNQRHFRHGHYFRHRQPQEADELRVTLRDRRDNITDFLDALPANATRYRSVHIGQTFFGFTVPRSAGVDSEWRLMQRLTALLQPPPHLVAIKEAMLARVSRTLLLLLLSFTHTHYTHSHT
jgi:hypothetical protein